MHILFLNKTRKGEPRTFDFRELESLRGGERTLLLLAQALGKRGHDVVLAIGKRGSAKAAYGNVTITDAAAALNDEYDAAVSNNYAHAFRGVRAKAKVIWVHNPGFSWSHVKADYLAKLRYRPHAVHLSEYTRGRSWFLPSAGTTIIHHGMPAELFQDRTAPSAPPNPVALFSSYAGRNLALVIDAWQSIVHPKLPEARLEITAEVEPKHVRFLGPDALADLNISIVGSVPWSDLMQRMHRARLLIAPGHFQETYNLLTVEAASCGLPTVTMGIGALGERVVHRGTGWIAGNVEEMGEGILSLLSDDELWKQCHAGCLSHPDLVSWDEQAMAWESCLQSLLETHGSDSAR